MTEWWNAATGNGILLSRRHVQALVFSLPDLKRGELEATLRYKVRTILPVQADTFTFHNQVFRLGGQTFGAALLANGEVGGLDLARAKALRLGFPLTVPGAWGPRVLLLVASPEGLEAHYYESRVLKTSFAPFLPRERGLLRHILELHPQARVLGWAPDPHYVLPEDIAETAPSDLLTECPLWEPPRPRRLPLAAGIVLMVLGLGLGGWSAFDALAQRQHRNDVWKTWLKDAGPSPASTTQTPKALLKAQGLPVPEVFVRLSNAWRSGTQIESFQWTPGKLLLVARSQAALTSLKALTSDPWFQAMRVDDIHSLKEGGEQFAIEGDLNLEP